MSGFDEGNVFYSDQGATFAEADDEQLSRHAAKIKFTAFLRDFRGAPSVGNPHGTFVYRDALDQDPPPRALDVSVDDVVATDAELGRALKANPDQMIPLLEVAAEEVVLQLRAEKHEGEEPARPSVQVLLSSSEDERSLRTLTSGDVSKLVRVPGIVIATGRPKPFATRICLMCKNCKNSKYISNKHGFGGAFIPRTCDLQPAGTSLETNCGVDPFVIMPDKCEYVDQQMLKLQENPEEVPAGEMPRHMQLIVERTMVQQITPGTRVTVMGIFTIHNSAGGGAGGSKSRRDSKATVAIRLPYLRVVGVERSAESAARRPQFSDSEVREYKEFAQCPFPELLEKIRSKIAPSVFGAEDIKMAVACLMFGGSRKRLPDGTRLRGDVNVLMLGDPSTAKSQFLKFVEKAAPIAVYTSGKGSSAAGLTASVIRDASGEFYLEGGAMVLADGGVVCIDEFDKMRPEDRVAIHEAMEQQTISIAKAGITTVLNSRTAVLAAANPPSGRYDDLKTAQENIELQSTILSRFDLIFIVKDDRSYERDMELGGYVLNVHKNAADASATEANRERAAAEGWLKRYVEFARSACRPRLSEAARTMLESEYIRIRQQHRADARAAGGGAPAIPITVRQLEAIVRISESLAKMGLQSTATEVHVAEAVRLFNVATIDAAKCGQGEAAMSAELRAELAAVEAKVRTKLPLAGTISKRTLVEELTRFNLSEWAIDRALVAMVQRRELSLEAEGRKLRRIAQ